MEILKESILVFFELSELSLVTLVLGSWSSVRARSKIPVMDCLEGERRKHRPFFFLFLKLKTKLSTLFDEGVCIGI